MKNNYLILIVFFFFALSFAQTPIVTIDRANVTGPTTSGNVASISSVGLTRGVGISSGNGSDFSSKSWNASSQLEAATTNEYIQWSVSADANFDIDLTDLDIRLSRNNNGPQNWQIYYSLNGFTTLGIAIGSAQAATTTETNYNFSGLVVNSGDGGTITFRLYAWNANNNGGTFEISGDVNWADFGIADPGTRLSGQVNSEPLFSTESNIVSTSFDPTDNIDYTLFSATTGLSTTNAIKIGEFTIQDGGNDLIDVDVQPTILTDLTFAINGDTNIAALALFDGTTNVSETSTVASSTTFNGINSGAGISAPDNGTKTFSVYATFKTTVTDNDQLQLTITSASANGILGSSFETADAGGAQTPVAVDDNRIEVIATLLVFGTQPNDVSVFIVMTPAPTVLAVDTNNNIDMDYIGTVDMNSTGPSFDSSATLSVNAINGVATFDTIIFDSTGSNTSLLASTLDGLNSTISNPFNVLNLILTIASQDFDGSLPEWTYTTDVAFFDNGWATDGYYGIINSNSASPLDYTTFSQNILGANDLNDEGNGTTGFATVTFASVDISTYTDITLSFDWETDGYGNNDEAQYEVFYDGVGQGIVDLKNSGIEGTVALAIPDSVNTISLQVLIKISGETVFCGFDNFLLNSTFNGLIYHNNAWTPFAPSNGSGALNALVLDGTYTINSDVAINNIIVDDVATVLIEKGKSLVVNGGLICNKNITLQSDSTEYSSLIVEGNAIGDIKYERHVNNNAGGNDLVSAPVIGQTFGDFAIVNTNIFENPSDVSQKLFGPFNKTTGLYQLYDTDLTADADAVLDAGNGYRAASTDSGTFTFEGIVETTSIAKPIVISGPNSPEWNLIGNPYSSYITLSEFLTVNSNELEPTTSGIYGYDGDASDGWEIWNQAYSDDNPDAIITPGQGFLVASKIGGGTITFNPSMRSIGSTDDFIAERNINPYLAHLKLQMRKADASFNTDIYFNNNATLSLDSGYDSALFGNYAPGFAIYSHLVENHSGLKLAIQSVDYNALNDVVIPLGVNASQGEQLTFSILESDIQSSIDIYLEDTMTNTFTLLSNSDYVFTPNINLSGIGRFYLRFSGGALSISENNFETIQMFTTKSSESLFINGELNTNTTVEIYDIQGRLFLTSVLDINSRKNKVDISNLTTGIYIVKLDNGLQQKSQKVIIE